MVGDGCILNCSTVALCGVLFGVLILTDYLVASRKIRTFVLSR